MPKVSLSLLQQNTITGKIIIMESHLSPLSTYVTRRGYEK